jgi:hypothetical protein
VAVKCEESVAVDDRSKKVYVILNLSRYIYFRIPGSLEDEEDGCRELEARNAIFHKLSLELVIEKECFGFGAIKRCWNLERPSSRARATLALARSENNDELISDRMLL